MPSHYGHKKSKSTRMPKKKVIKKGTIKGRKKK